MIPRTEKCENCLRLCGVTGTGSHCSNTTFKRSNPLFEHVRSWIHQTSIDVSQFLQGEQVSGVFGALELVARCLVQRHGPAARGGVGCIACMELAGGET